jgi:hypothetical protein
MDREEPPIIYGDPDWSRIEPPPSDAVPAAPWRMVGIWSQHPYRLAVGLACALLLAGVGYQALGSVRLVGDGEFGLELDRLYETHEDMVVRLKVHAADKLHRQVWSSGIAGAWRAEIDTSQRPPAGTDTHPGDIWLCGATFFTNTQQYLKTVIGGKRDYRPASRRDGTYRRLHVTIGPGKYPLNTPIAIGKVDGETVYLAVGTADVLEGLRAKTQRFRPSTAEPFTIEDRPLNPSYLLRSL